MTDLHEKNAALFFARQVVKVVVAKGRSQNHSSAFSVNYNDRLKEQHASDRLYSAHI